MRHLYRAHLVLEQSEVSGHCSLDVKISGGKTVHLYVLDGMIPGVGDTLKIRRKRYRVTARVFEYTGLPSGSVAADVTIHCKQEK